MGFFSVYFQHTISNGLDIHYASDQECTALHTPTCALLGLGLVLGYLLYSSTVLDGATHCTGSGQPGVEVARWCGNVNTDTLDYTQSR